MERGDRAFICPNRLHILRKRHQCPLPIVLRDPYPSSAVLPWWSLWRQRSSVSSYSPDSSALISTSRATSPGQPYAHQQALQSSRILHLFANDVGTAIRVNAASNWQVQLQMQASIVMYTYTPASNTLQRTDLGTGATVILRGITPLPLGFSTPPYSTNIFNYYNTAMVSLLPAPTAYPPTNKSVVSLIDIRQIELSFLASDGIANNGTLVKTPTVSSRIILRNKPPLGQ